MSRPPTRTASRLDSGPAGSGNAEGSDTVLGEVQLMGRCLEAPPSIQPCALWGAGTPPFWLAGEGV